MDRGKVKLSASKILLKKEIFDSSGDDSRTYTSTMEILRDVIVMHDGPDLTEVCEYSLLRLK